MNEAEGRVGRISNLNSEGLGLNPCFLAVSVTWGNSFNSFDLGFFIYKMWIIYLALSTSHGYRNIFFQQKTKNRYARVINSHFQNYTKNANWP